MGPVYYISPLLEAAGAPHAFSTRVGGTSPAPFDSLNLGNPNGCAVQDASDRINANYRLLQVAIGCGDRALCHVHQVHGRDVAIADARRPFDPSQRADAIVSSDPEKILSVRVADCVPVLLSSGDGKIVAAVHAGWRGLVANVIGEAVNALQELSAACRSCRTDVGATLASPSSTGNKGDASVAPTTGRETGLIAAVGPCIGAEAFEVGDEVAAEFVRAFGDRVPLVVRHPTDAKPRIDLREAARLQLIDAGLSPDRIDTTDRCTYRHADEFYSHRRDNGVTGRMAALITPKG